jgi:hypothetical protein
MNYNHYQLFDQLFVLRTVCVMLHVIVEFVNRFAAVNFEFGQRHLVKVTAGDQVIVVVQFKGVVYVRLGRSVALWLITATVCCGRLETVRIHGLPLPHIATHVNNGIFGFPAQDFFGFDRVRINASNVSGSPSAYLMDNFNLIRLFERVY